MPRFNLRGDLTGGYGDIQPLWIRFRDGSFMTIDRLVGACGWQDAETHLCIESRNGKRCVVRRTKGGLWQDDTVILEKDHLNALYAGGGNFLAGIPGQTWGVVKGRDFDANLSVIAAEQDGSYILKGAANGEREQVFWHDESFTLFPLTSLRVWNGLVMGLINDRTIDVFGHDVTVHPRDAKHWTGVAFRDFAEKLWLFYNVDGIGWILHRADDPTIGYRFGGDVFRPDVWFDGPVCHLAYATGEGEDISVIRYLTLNLGHDMVPIPQGTEPVPVPPSPPEPPPMPELPNLKTIVERVRQRFGPPDARPTNDQMGAMCVEIACEANAVHMTDEWGVSRKAAGNNAQTVVGPIAVDIVQHRSTETLFDVFVGDGFATPTWGEAEPHHNPDRPWVAPKCDGAPVPVPPQPPTTPPVPPTPPGVDPWLKAMVEDILGTIQLIESKQIEGANQQSLLMAKVDRIEQHARFVDEEARKIYARQGSPYTGSTKAFGGAVTLSPQHPQE